MAELITSENITARCSHECDTCGRRRVRPGDIYIRTVYKQDGSVFCWNECRRCSRVMEAACREDEVFRWELQDEGLETGDLKSWLHDRIRSRHPMTTR